MNCIARLKLYCRIEVYCSLVTSEIVLQYSLLNCIAGEGEKAIGIVLQYNFCIVTEAIRLWGRFVLQYKLYCEVQEQEARLPVSQGRQLCRDTACAPHVGVGHWAGRKQARRAQQASGAHNRRPRHGGVGQRARRLAGAGVHGRGARHGRWACCWPTGCALGALSLFLTRFDSVLFLSQFLDIVREPGS